MSEAAARCWGVYRELAHSPGRETDDAEILGATGRELAALGFAVSFKSPDELPEAEDFAAVPPFLFVMCERIPVVERLAAWEGRGTRIVNRPSGIRNTDRERTIALFRSEEVPHPPSFLVSTELPARAAFAGPCWLKRADVHATQEGDVSFAASKEELGANLERLRARGIRRAASGPPSWLQWFYHRDQTLSNHAFDPDALAAATAKAAGALGLDVYGGDAIVSADGGIRVIDLNAWPSFALFRPVAAARIAALLAARFVRSGVMR